MEGGGTGGAGVAWKERDREIRGGDCSANRGDLQG